MRRRLAWTIGAVMVGLGSGLDAAAAQEGAAKQQATTAEQRLERAILLQEVERDLPGAIDAYRVVAEDASASKETRAKACGRLVRALRSLARHDDATQATRWAIDAGLVTEEAAKAWSSEGEVDARLRERVFHSVSVLLDAARTEKADDAGASLAGYDDLVWIGEPAVPFIVEQILARASDLDAVVLLTQVVARIGGNSAIRFVEQVADSRDELFKRTVIKGLRGGSFGRTDSPKGGGSAAHASLLRFVRDPSVAVRRDATELLGSKLADDTLATLLADSDLEVRASALDGFRKRQIEDRAIVEVLGRAIREAFSGDDSKLSGIARHLLKGGGLLATKPGVELSLDLLVEAADQPRWPVDWAPSAVGSTRQGATLEISMAELVEVAKKFGPFEPRSNRPAQTGQTFGRAAEKSRGETIQLTLEFLGQRRFEALDPQRGLAARDPFDDAERPFVFELLALGLRGQFESWAQRYARPDELPMLAAAFERSGNTGLLSRVDNLVGAAEEKARAEAASHLTRFLERNREVDGLSRDERHERTTDLAKVSHALIAMRVPGTGASIVAAIRAQPADDASLWRNLVPVLPKYPEAFSDADLIALMTMAVASEDTTSASAKATMFRILVSRGSESGIAALPDLFRHFGLENDQQILRQLIAIRSPSANAGADAPPVSVEVVRQAVRDSLALARNVVWLNAVAVVDQLPGNLDDPSMRAVVEEILAAVLMPSLAVGRPEITENRRFIARRITKDFADSFEGFVADALDDAALRDVVASALKSPLPERVRTQLEKNLSKLDGDTLARTIPRLGDFGDERSARSIVPLLDHADPRVRARAVAELPDLPLEDGWKRASELLADPSAMVRVEACRALGRMVDPRAVPLLVEMLRDEAVRDEAKAALEKIQFYVDQKSRWDKLSAAGGLDATSAAAALLKQAAASQSKDVRLAAIASLGTLGVAETLPMLIGWMNDVDREVAAAAKQAVASINAKAARESAGSKKDGDAKEK